MKKLIILFFILLPTLGISQETLTVNTKDLPPEILQQLKEKQKVDQVTEKIETYGKWAGMGKEVGVAVRDGLTAVKDVAVDFSKTDVGMFTMVLIAWKVVGEDVTSLFVGVMIFIVGITLLSISWNRSLRQYKKVLIEGGWFKPKKYEVIQNRLDSEEYAWVCVAHILGMFVLIGITAAIIF